MTIAKGLLAAAISLASLTAAASANAAVVFTLQDVKFDDGTLVTGSFTTDDARTTILDFSIQTATGTNAGLTGGRFPTAGFDWTSTSANGFVTQTGVRFSQRNAIMFGRGLNLNFAIQTGGESAVTGNEGQMIYSRNIMGGQIVSPLVATAPGGGGPGSGGPTPATGAVPEPATWAMMMLGFGAMGASLRTRRRTAKIAFA